MQLQIHIQLYIINHYRDILSSSCSFCDLFNKQKTQDTNLYVVYKENPASFIAHRRYRKYIHFIEPLTTHFSACSRIKKYHM